MAPGCLWPWLPYEKLESSEPLMRSACDYLLAHRPLEATYSRLPNPRTNNSTSTHRA